MNFYNLTPHEVACRLYETYKTRDMNEADTRHQLIDVILHKILMWPENSVKCEKNIRTGYCDYLLKSKSNKNLIILEAKNEGKYFNLPASFGNNKYIQLKTLLTDPNIRDAIEQVQKYGIDEGCEFASIVNGHEWVFFKTFEKNKKWIDLKAFIVRDLNYFCELFTEAINNFGYTSIIENYSLHSLLSTYYPFNRDLFYPKNKITSYNHPVSSNRFTSCIGPLSARYLGVLNEQDVDFMNNCYVSQRDFTINYEGVTSIIYDNLSPYFKQFNVQDFVDDREGGKFGEEIKRNVKYTRKNDVIILFGGKGCGKSSFIKKLLFHKPPNEIKHFSIIAMVDLLSIPEDKAKIYKEIWKRILYDIDKNALLKQHRIKLLELFEDKFEISKKQDLFGIDEKSETYNIKLNELVGQWKSDEIYCTQRICNYWKKQQKGTIIVLDNTDQYDPSIQDYCFSIAQEISIKLNSLVIICMREERFHYSVKAGTLDAFQKNGFHLSSPPPKQVFIKRIRYINSILNSERKIPDILDRYSKKDIADLQKFLKIIINELGKEKSPFNKFFDACTHGDIRFALFLFANFLHSGYTNIDEMIAHDTWTIATHQVLKPIMVPDRFYYDEDKSNIPNIYQIRSTRHGSHFTALRILSKLQQRGNLSDPYYITISEIRNYFAEIFDMVEDCEKNIDILLVRGLVEANNRLDRFSDDVDSIKITTYGTYFLQELYKLFTYIEQICIDCGLYNEKVASFLVNESEEELKLFLNRRKLERLEKRLEKAERFISYLKEEEMREWDTFSLSPDEYKYCDELGHHFDQEKKRVYASAVKNQ